MQQKGIIAIFIRWNSQGKTVEFVVIRTHAIAPVFQGKRRIGHDIIEAFETSIGFFVGRTRQGIIGYNLRSRTIVQDHIHPREVGRRGFFFLSVKGNIFARFVGHFQQQRPRAAGRVIGCGLVGRILWTDANDFGQYPRHFGRRVKLPFGLPRFRGKVAHQVFVGIAQNIIAFGRISREIQGVIVEDAYQVGYRIHQIFALS